MQQTGKPDVAPALYELEDYILPTYSSMGSHVMDE